MVLHNRRMAPSSELGDAAALRGALRGGVGRPEPLGAGHRRRDSAPSPGVRRGGPHRARGRRHRAVPRSARGFVRTPTTQRRRGGPSAQPRPAPSPGGTHPGGDDERLSHRVPRDVERDPDANHQPGAIVELGAVAVGRPGVDVGATRQFGGRGGLRGNHPARGCRPDDAVATAAQRHLRRGAPARRPRIDRARTGFRSGQGLPGDRQPFGVVGTRARLNGFRRQLARSLARGGRPQRSRAERRW